MSHTEGIKMEGKKWYYCTHMIFSLILALFASSVQSCEAGYKETAPIREVMAVCKSGYSPFPLTGQNQFLNCSKTVNGLVVDKYPRCVRQPFIPSDLVGKLYWKGPTASANSCLYIGCIEKKTAS